MKLPNLFSSKTSKNLQDTFTDPRDGKVYKVVKIGNQVWMAENLTVNKFRNGDLIPHVESKEEWEKAGYESKPAWCCYNNDFEKGIEYGKLYNCYAVNDPGGLAPNDWHVPTDTEWEILINHLRGEASAGGKLKETETTHWESPNEGGNNKTGFTALPGGSRYLGGTFSGIGSLGYWWSATELFSHIAWYREMSWNSSYVTRSNIYKRLGFSVRCVRD